MRRILRIFPLYYLYLCLHFFLKPFIFSYPVPLASTQLWAWFYMGNIPSLFEQMPHVAALLKTSGPSHFWSLAVEEHFYLLWPLLTFYLPERPFRRVVISILVLSPVLRFVLLSHGFQVYHFTLTRMDSIAFGALVAVLAGSEDRLPWSVTIGARWLLALIPAVVFGLFWIYGDGNIPWLQAFKFSCISAFYASSIAFCVFDPLGRVPRRIFSMSVFRWLGRISYGLYVYHPLCFQLEAQFFASAFVMLNFTVSVLTTTVVSYLSFRYFESPFLLMKKRFKYSTSHPGSATAPTV